MKGQRTVGQYRTIDLTLFALMLILSETVIARAATGWFPEQPYTVSVTAAITAIVMMRWGPWAGIHALLGGLVYCWASGGSGVHYAIYCAGNLLSLGALALRKAWGAEGIRQSVARSLALGAAVQLLMQVGRAMVSLCFGVSAGEAVLFVTTDALSIAFTLVIVWIVRRLDGVYEDQRHYLFRMQQEQEKDKGGFR